MAPLIMSVGGSDMERLVDEGLVVVGQALAPYIEAELRNHYGSHWWRDGVVPSLRGEMRRATTIGELDLQALLDILRHDQRTAVFQRTLSNEAFGLATVLTNIRNRRSHRGVGDSRPFTGDETGHALDTMTLFLRLISSDRAEVTAALARQARGDHVRTADSESNSTGPSVINTCCENVHPFDAVEVVGEWFPSPLKCLIVGESPGTPGSPYFYDPVPTGQTDPVEIRRYLLSKLAAAGLIQAASLESFKRSGYLFDHAIRCQLPSAEIKRQWRLAKNFRSDRAHNATHLRPVIEAAPKVWLMGRLARDSAVHFSALSREVVDRDLDPPFVPAGQSKFFVSRYLNRFADHDEIIVVFKRFMSGD